MNKITILLMSLLFSTSVIAQTQLHRRGRIENLSDYSSSVTTQSSVRRVGSLASAPLTCMGSPKIPVVLVQFSDLKFTVDSTEARVNTFFDNFFNQKTGNADLSLGSVYQYFEEQSYGQFLPEFKVVGPVTLSKNYAYYGKNGARTDVNINYFYSEACKLAESSNNIDWNEFDNNNDGKVDMVFFIYAGVGENASEDANTIWPKEGSTDFTVTVDSKKIVFGSYGCTNELYSNAADGIGTACHELSHSLGLPDLYDTSNNQCLGPDYWDLMDSGSYIVLGRAPCCFSAYERDFMQWRSLVTLENDSAYSLTLEPMETTGVGYKIVNKANKNEYFILENRQNIGYDTYLCWPSAKYYKTYGGQHGLMITHVNYSSSLWSKNSVNTVANKLGLSLVPADGQTVSSYDGFTTPWVESVCGDLYPGSGNVTEMSSYALYTGGTLDQTITNIREIDGNIRVDINGGTVIPALLKQLSASIQSAEAIKDEKMDASIATKLADLIDSYVSNDEESIAAAVKETDDAVAAAVKSIEEYKEVAVIIAKASELGEAGQTSFAESGIANDYANGTIKSVDDAQKAYDAAVAVQEKADAIVSVSGNASSEASLYGADGSERSALVKGINLIRFSDGTVKKVMKK